MIKYKIITGLIVSTIFLHTAETDLKILEENSTKSKEDMELSDELKGEVFTAIYSINGKKYNIETLPFPYAQSSGKKRKLFLEKYLNYSMTLNGLKKEQKNYKGQIDKEITKALDRNRYLGINIDELDKKLLILDKTIKTIAKEELAKDIKDLDKKIKKFYDENQKDYIYPDNIELSYIYFKDEESSKKVFDELTQDKVTVKRFAAFAKKYSTNKKLKFVGGYFGFLSKTTKQEKFFNQLWNTKKNGLVNEVLKRDDYFFIVYIHQKRKAFTDKFENVKEDIHNNILNKHAKVNKWINIRYRKIMKKTKIDVFDNFEDNRSF